MSTTTATLRPKNRAAGERRGTIEVPAGPSQVNVRLLDRECDPAWDSYVLGHPEGTLFHLTAWKRAIEREFGFEARYLLAERAGEILGVLPLFRTSSLFQGSALISVPFAVYGGVCSTNSEATQALLNEACRIAGNEAVQYLELREQDRSHDRFQTKTLYVTFQQELSRDPDTLMRGLPKDTRYMIRKGQKRGLQVVDGPDQIGCFHEIYARSVRKLGTPVFSKNFFRVLLEEFGDACEVTTIWHQSKPLAGVLSLRFRDAILPYYGGSLPDGRQYAANNFMYWELLRRACETGLREFDFGRSKIGTGSYFFKTQWNMKEKPLPYQYYLVKRKSMPNFSPANHRFKLATDVWKHVPLSLTKALGPTLVRLFP